MKRLLLAGLLMAALAFALAAQSDPGTQALIDKQFMIIGRLTTQVQLLNEENTRLKAQIAAMAATATPEPKDESR